jgi:hypothetical protein
MRVGGGVLGHASLAMNQSYLELLVAQLMASFNQCAEQT